MFSDLRSIIFSHIIDLPVFTEYDQYRTHPDGLGSGFHSCCTCLRQTHWKGEQGLILLFVFYSHN